MVDVEPYGASDVGGDPFDDDLPSLASSSSGDDDYPHDPDDTDRATQGKKKKKKKKKERGKKGRRPHESKAIATSKIMVNLPEFSGKYLSEFAESFGRGLRMTGQAHASGRVQRGVLVQCRKTKYLEKQVKRIVTKSAESADVLVALERQYPSYETELSI